MIVSTPVYHPQLPAPLVLENEMFTRCPNEDPTRFVCMDRDNARKIVRNKTKTLKWVKDARAVMDYYAGEDPQRVK